MERFTMLLLCFGALFSLLTSSNAADTLATNDAMRDGETILSADGMFELGFFSLGNSKNRYLGIWYKKVSNQTVVWIANRDAPLNSTSGMLQVSSDGILRLLNDGDTIWSSSLVSLRNIAPVAQLLDNGNLVVRDERSTDQRIFIWQSFDYPTDTLLLGMKLGKDLVTGIDRHLISWKSTDDPSTGQYMAYMDTNGFPQIFVRQGNSLHSRSGPWNGVRFSGMPEWRVKATALKEFVFNEKEIYYRYKVRDSSVISRLYMNPEGYLTRMNWVDSTQSWFQLLATVPVDSCSLYGLCGAFGTCNANNFPVCNCMGGFEPKHPEQWSVADWSGGCTRRTPLNCGGGDGFRRISDLDIRNGGSGCLLWFDELMDVREYDETQNLYIRMAISELTSLTTLESGSNKKKHIILAVVLASVCLVLVGLCLAIYARSKKKRYYLNRQDSINEGRNEDAELPTFSLSKIAKSTSNFSITNKLGEGGFGAVYKVTNNLK
ncbi:hypothetical protein L6452_05629 [Arctium lappa]|uniref:Uncharacterized protein n=1 Tax=Arctium lappa TaxID=4217 RepID=A0ACB9EI03_ARCLA|nr:hypothetical protein L6452_05629 [Arctium lappa]